MVQGLTLPYILKHSKSLQVFTGEAEEVALQKLRKGLHEHTHQFLQNKHDSGLHDQELMQKLIRHWDEKMEAAKEGRMNEKTKLIFLEMLESQRNYLAEINKDPAFDEEIIRGQLYQLDLEEERLNAL